MDVCVLGCTPGHIPRYMSQTSNNNSIGLLSCPLWCLLWLLIILLWHLYRTPVMILVMTPVMYSCYHSCHDPFYDSCFDICYGLLLWTHVILVMYSCYDYRVIGNSDSIHLDIRWHEIKVYRWGFPCLDYSFDVLVSWDRDLSVYNQSCL